ncbi:type II secretion system F family protein [Paenibacillus sp. ACRRX]|uniref:type II secretion system F family protein n=1 Tax=unclassified Paenibacillus TaxID=185978 RepID=UPI001EF426DC|nr:MULTISPECIES: type II secretion system F family protein [unclassified Paenibacillus]MCG7410015.1 type II secretion system F family protein [Paenibacillus sp. ACRRX]MDK8182920.1 type II secretion system F family protein [Paenibacillus sp. UMB4589-SE434]
MSKGVWLVAAIACFGVLWFANRRTKTVYQEIVRLSASKKLALWLPIFLHLITFIQSSLDTHPLLVSIRQALYQLHGPTQSYNQFRLFMAELTFIAYVGIPLGFLFTAMTDGRITNMTGGGLLALLLILARVKDVLNKAERKRQELQMELPELLSKLTLLVQAGETVQKALYTCVQRKSRQLEHPLYKELDRMMKDVQNGYAFVQALEQFSKRCATQEVAMFSTTLLINQRRGGASFVLAMEELGRQLWDKRKAVARKRGEEASTKLILPMMLMFLVILAVVGGPAFLMMK